MPAGELKFAEMSNGKTRYYDAGAGDPVILIHGAGFWSGYHNWNRNVPALAEHFRVLSVDCLGFGLTDGLEQPYSFAYLVDFLREFQDVLGLSSSHIVGHSMGGWLGPLLAYESPNRVDKLVIVDGGGAITRPLPGMANWSPPDEEHLSKQVLMLAGDDEEGHAVLKQRLEATQDAELCARFKGLMTHMSDGEARARYNLLRRLPYITVPTLVVWGENDKTNALELGRQTAELIPGAEFVMFEGIDHYVPQMAPERFNETVINFLQK